jgi:hypothetical protein
VRKSVIVTSLVVAAVGVLAGFAVADALRSGRPSSTWAEAALTTPSVSTEPEVVTVPSVSPEQEIERIGNSWAPLFGAGQGCRYMTQPLCERIACIRVAGIKIRKCTPPTSGFRNSFFGATVQDVEIRGHRAAARFANGEVVELWGDGGTWLISKLGGKAGRRFFE